MLVGVQRGLHEECGVFGVFGVKGAPGLSYYGLHALQHRGQESCGIVSYDSCTGFHTVKGQGLVSEVFNPEKLGTMDGDRSIGHVRYSTAGGNSLANVQPFFFRTHMGGFALAHNGNLVNYVQLRAHLESLGSLFQSTSDSEVLAHLILKCTRDASENSVSAICEALNMVEGAFSFLILTPERLYACRDKHGFRPLSIASLGDGYVVSSETCALEATGARFIRDVEPGEVVVIDREGIHSSRYSVYRHNFMCAMEYIYFARPDSVIEGRNVHDFRKMSGRLLYEESHVDADIVVGVPDSSLSAAIGYAEASGLPYELGLVKNKYIGRTFIQPSQEMRENGVRMKLSAVRSIVEGKRIILIDDSVVRGTTSRRIVRMLREAGATEVHLRIASPQLIRPCYYGVDISTQEELFCASRSLEQARESLGVDSLAFISKEAMFRSGCRSELCLACFTGEYPTYHEAGK